MTREAHYASTGRKLENDVKQVREGITQELVSQRRQCAKLQADKDRLQADNVRLQADKVHQLQSASEATHVLGVLLTKTAEEKEALEQTLQESKAQKESLQCELEQQLQQSQNTIQELEKQLMLQPVPPPPPPPSLPRLAVMRHSVRMRPANAAVSDSGMRGADR